MSTDKKQRRLETGFIASLFYPRWFMAVMDGALNAGLNESCFRQADTRAAWLAITALHTARGQEWRKKRSADDIAVKTAAEETLKPSELEKAKPEAFSLDAVHAMACSLVSESEKHSFKSALETSMKMISDCADVQTAVLLSRQAISRWENTACVRNSAVDIPKVGAGLAEGYKRSTDDRIAGLKVLPKGLPMPWGVLNEYYNGLKNGLHVIAARPSEGKTGFAINLSAFWRENGIKHAFISLDMPVDEAVKRYGCFETELTDKRLSNGLASYEDIERYKEAIASYRDAVYLYESPELSTVEMAIREAHHAGARSAIIDYLQLIQVKGCKNKWDAIIAATASLKQMTRELKIPIIVLAQLNRQGVRDGREPELHDIEGGGFIEQAAATVMTMGRDKTVCEQWAINPPTQLTGGHEPLAKWLRPVWLNLLKNQQGAIGKFPFVMFCPFFALRPGNHKAAGDGKNNGSFFSEVNDDWRMFSFDNKRGQE